MLCIKKGNYLAILLVFGNKYSNSCGENSAFNYLKKLCEENNIPCQKQNMKTEKWFFIDYDKIQE